MTPKHKLLIHIKSNEGIVILVAIKLKIFVVFKTNSDFRMVETKNQISDGELVLKLAGYNAQAFEQLFNRYSAFLYGFIKRILSDSKLSEQVLLNVFAIFWKRIDNYDTTTNNVFTYLTMLTRNKAIDVLKRMDEHKLSPIYDENYENEKILPKLSPIVKPITLELALAFGERIRFYKTQLTEIQNLVLNMVFFEGLTDEEISKKLNIPETTVKQKVQTTLGALMQNLSGKNLEASGNKKVIELIKLEAIGRLSPDEKEYLTNQKLEDPEFPWALLGEYQNLVALLSSVIVPENPSVELTNEIKNLFNNVLIGKTDQYNVVIPNKFTTNSVKDIKPVEKPTENSSEEFPIRFKEPSKQDLDIIEELSQNITQPIKPTSESEVSKPVIKEPVAVENKILSKPVVETKITEALSPKPAEALENKKETKTIDKIHEKTDQQTKSEVSKPVSEINTKTADTVSLNKKLNQILSKTEEIKVKNKLVVENKITEAKKAETKHVEEKRESKVTGEKDNQLKTDSNKKRDDLKELNKVLAKAEQSAVKEERKADNKKPVEEKLPAKDNKISENRTEKKLSEENQPIEKLIEDYKQTYEKEIGTLQKKLRRNIMITVGLIILLLGGAAAIFLSMQKDSPQLVTKVENPVTNQTQPFNPMVENESNQTQQQNVTQTQTVQQNTQPQSVDLKTQQNQTQQTTQQRTEQVKSEGQKVVYPPLPEAPKIIEQTVNGESNRNSDNNRKENDAVTNKVEKKTEEVIPPKEEKPVTEEPAFFVAVEEPPQPIGGLANIQKKIVYPEIAKRLEVQGKVLVQAIIDENGNVAKAKVIKGIGSGCDEVALDAVKSSKFTPGKQRGKNVRVQITIPIVFKL